MTGDNQASEVEAMRGRLIERVHQQIREAETMTDMRATEQLLTFIGANADDAGIRRAAIELRSRGDTFVRRDDFQTLLRHVDPLGRDEALESALERIQDAIGGA